MISLLSQQNQLQDNTKMGLKKVAGEELLTVSVALLHEGIRASGCIVPVFLTWALLGGVHL
jgi:hypothetical protein